MGSLKSGIVFLAGFSVVLGFGCRPDTSLDWQPLWNNGLAYTFEVVNQRPDSIEVTLTPVMGLGNDLAAGGPAGTLSLKPGASATTSIRNATASGEFQNFFRSFVVEISGPSTAATMDVGWTEGQWPSRAWKGRTENQYGLGCSDYPTFHWDSRLIPPGSVLDDPLGEPHYRVVLEADGSTTWTLTNLKSASP